MESIFKNLYGNLVFALLLTMAGLGCDRLQKLKLVSVSNLRSETESDNSSFQRTLGTARFTVITPECIRIERSDSKRFIDDPSFFASERNLAHYDNSQIFQNGNTLTIDTGKIKLIYTNDGQEFSASNLNAFISRTDNQVIQWFPGLPNFQNLKGSLMSLDQAKGPVPLDDGLLSKDGWYLLDDSKRPLLINGDIVDRPNTSATDWYLFGYGNDYKRALVALTTIGGKIPIPRKYALGSWYSRFFNYTAADLVSIVDGYHDNDFPLDVLVIDLEWHRNFWTGYSWDKTAFPDPVKFLKSMHDKGIRVTLNDHPGDMLPNEDADIYNTFMTDALASGLNPSNKSVIPYDPRNINLLNILFQDAYAVHEKEGVDFWWLDYFDQDTIGRLNTFYFNHSAQNNKRGISFSRWAGWGDHRHPIQFSGDTDTGFPMLAFEIPFTSTSANVGAFYWSHDIGGHLGARNEESFVRWVQFGATSTSLRVHSTFDPNLDRRPWLWGPAAVAAMRKTYHIRSELFPYIYSAASEAYTDSLPIVRPLYIEYPDTDEAYNNSQEYLFGNSFLVAPVTTAVSGKDPVATQTVWFPPGDWYHWMTGEKISGNQKLLISSHLDEFPIYVRGGSPIVMQPYTERMASTSLPVLKVRTYPGGASSSILYEDDGVTQDYINGKNTHTLISYVENDNHVTLTVSPTVGGNYDGKLDSRSYIFEFPGIPMAINATLNGKNIFATYDSVKKMAVFTIENTLISNSIELKFDKATNISPRIDGGHIISCQDLKPDGSIRNIYYNEYRIVADFPEDSLACSFQFIFSGAKTCVYGDGSVGQFDCASGIFTYTQTGRSPPSQDLTGTADLTISDGLVTLTRTFRSTCAAQSKTCFFEMVLAK